jgi:hypothetical protein
MAISFKIQDPIGIISVDDFDIQPGLPDEITVKEINIVESLLSPAVQVSATIQSNLYKPSGKDFDQFKNKEMSFTLSRDTDKKRMKVSQQCYRLDNRDFALGNVGNAEEMTFHAIDKTVLKDAQTLVSKSWKCTKPSEVVSNVLDECLEADETEVKSADPARDYIAENIHPFQVIAQQSQVALDGDDPSFVHFMTLNPDSGKGVHHFESLKSMTEGDSIETYQYGDSVWTGGGGYQNKKVALSFSFPCDFDYLSDLLNGLDENGENKNSGAFINQVFKQIFGMSEGGGGFTGHCGMGGHNFKEGISNKSTAQQQNSCNIDVESHLLKRQARMGLLEKDKIALRIVVPWNPQLHAGKLITLEWQNKLDKSKVYGSGDYLISSLMHTIKFGGFSTTTMDCVAKSVGQGVV